MQYHLRVERVKNAHNAKIINVMCVLTLKMGDIHASFELDSGSITFKLLAIAVAST